MSQHPLDGIKSKILQSTSLVDLIGSQLSVQRQQHRTVALCPFHPEKSPSFYIYEDHFHCFGCHAHGDAITFAQKQMGLGFIDALKWLGQRCGVDVDEAMGKTDQAPFKKQKALQQILSKAHQFFQEHLQNTQGGKQTIEYLKKRGLTEEKILEWGIGYAPDAPNRLLQHLKQQGFSLQDMMDASLVSKVGANHRDFFSHRLMFPIADDLGRIIAFGGRTMGESPQKYKNSRFEKGLYLFGLHQAKQGIRLKNRVIIVEGYFDALLLWEKGFTETVACQGSAVTKEHLQKLRHLTGLVYLLFDGDLAGIKAGLKTVDQAMNFPQMQFKVPLLPEKEDPDTFVRSNGAEKLESLLFEAQDLVDYAIYQKLQKTPELGRSELLRSELLPWVMKTPDAIQRGFLLNKLSRLSGVEVATLLEYQVKVDYKPQPTQPPREKAEDLSATSIDDLPLFLREFFGHLYFADPQLLEVPELQKFAREELQLEKVWEDLLQAMFDAFSQGQCPARTENIQWLGVHSPVIEGFLEYCLQFQKAFECKEPMKRLQQVLLHHKQGKLREALKSLKKQLTSHRIQGAGGTNDVREILAAITGVNRDLLALEQAIIQLSSPQS